MKDIRNKILWSIVIALIISCVIMGFKLTKAGGVRVKQENSEVTGGNRLANENSPYLLQHADNPVNWYPWGAEAFEAARKQDKPIFLSIGYSTCHWCHVMETESFENERIAKIMNENFISIKVDREQRPDVDDIYMTAVRMMTGSGGWPLSVFLTSDGHPFFGGTYFPPTNMYGRPGFDHVLLRIAEAWKNRRSELTESAEKVGEILNAQMSTTGKANLNTELLAQAYKYFENSFDNANAGFGIAPKFPQSTNLSMLMGYWYRTGNKKALDMTTRTLEAMAKGGIRDHLRGGFHRYATDAVWLVPHFEKMLYDQAQLSLAYIQAYQITGNENYAEVARQIYDYVLSDMTDKAGGFYSAEDADSEGSEGTFYLWTAKEVDKILDDDEANIFKRYYGITSRGNFEGKNILHISESTAKLSKQFDKDEKTISDTLTNARTKLRAVQTKRPRPAKDDKIITSWNGLMISSLACGGAVLAEQKYIEAAERAAEFVMNNLKQNSRLFRYYRKGKAGTKAYLDDYAFMITGLLELYQATFNTKWLSEAQLLATEMIKLFGDDSEGGFFKTGRDSERLIVRNKTSYDGATPSGNSVAALSLLKLGRITMQKQLEEQGKKTLGLFSAQMAQSPGASTAMLIALNFYLGPSQEIVIAGEANSTDTKEMIELVRSRFLPNSIVLLHESGQKAADIERIAEFIKYQVPIDGKATAYVCENYSCKQPVTQPSQLKKILKEMEIAGQRQ